MNCFIRCGVLRPGGRVKWQGAGGHDLSGHIVFYYRVSRCIYADTVLPQFASMLQEQELPWITRMMMKLSFSLRSRGVLYIMLILVLMALFKGILTCPFVRLQADRAVLYTPMIGKLLRTVYTSRFASAFAVLYGSGIGILDAMHTVVG